MKQIDPDNVGGFDRRLTPQPTTAIVLIKHTYVVTSQDKETRLLYLLELEKNGNLKNKFVYKMKDNETFPQQGYFKITYKEKDHEDYWPMIATDVEFQYI